MKNTALLVAGLILSVETLLHLSRLYFDFSIIIGGYSLPLWVDVVGFIVNGSLSYWMFMAYSEKIKKT